MMEFNTYKLKQLLIEIEKYLDVVDNTALLFYQAVKKYNQGKMDSFSRHYLEITELESQADDLRSNIRYKLYAFMLLPSARGDVWGLLENLDNVVDMVEKVTEQFSIERPQIPKELIEPINLLSENTSQAVLELVKASRAFFKEPASVTTYLNKVSFYENHVMKIAEDTVKKIFNSDLITIYSRKMHLRDILENMVNITILSDKVGERLSVYAIKRIS